MTIEPLMCTTSLDESPAARVCELGKAYIRYSEGPDRDVEESVDTESGLTLPGLSVNPLHPEDWWTRPIQDWLARQVCQYKELQEKNPDRFAWVLRGIEVGRGPDCEPLVRGLVERYRERFEAGKGPED